jgi:hypothetical protein
MRTAKRDLNPIRFLRRPSTSSSFEVNQVNMEPEYDDQAAGKRELESRVHQWLKGSKPPAVITSKPAPMLEDNFENNIQQDESTAHNAVCLDDTLYHPDFADWASVKLVEPRKYSYTADPSPLKALDEATATISNLLKLQFDILG